MTILLTGGTGKTASRIAKLLQAQNIPVLLTSRRGQEGVPDGFKGVKFDWHDPSTYNPIFETDNNIDKVYLVLAAPHPDHDPVELGKKFIDIAKAKGVHHFVLLTASIIEKGGPLPGQVHAYLEEVDVDYAVIRPSWFYGNFLVNPSIKEKDELVSATGTGKIGFIAEDDIAEIAVDLLTKEKLNGTDRLIYGPDLLSYDEVAEQFSQVLGRKITHRSVSVDERITSYTSHGVPAETAKILANVEAHVVAGGYEEKRYTDPTLDKGIGKIRFRDWVEEHKSTWQK